MTPFSMGSPRSTRDDSRTANPDFGPSWRRIPAILGDISSSPSRNGGSSSSWARRWTARISTSTSWSPFGWRRSSSTRALSSLGTAYIFLAQYRASQKKVFRAASAAKKGRGFLEKAVARDPELVDPRFGLGAYNYYSDKVNLLVKGLRTLLFLPGGDSEKGLNQLREVAERGHYFRTEAHLLLGIIFQNHHEHRYLEALGHFRSALALNPGSPIILGTIGEMEIRLGRYPDAQSTLRRCIEIAGRSEDPEQQELARMSRILLSDSLSLSLHSVEAMDELETALNGGEVQPVFRNRALTVATQAAGANLPAPLGHGGGTPETSSTIWRRTGGDPDLPDIEACTPGNGAREAREGA